MFVGKHGKEHNDSRFVNHSTNSLLLLAKTTNRMRTCSFVVFIAVVITTAVSIPNPGKDFTVKNCYGPESESRNTLY
ncbi:hypothetical protein DPEC_G00206480 [Dallia pectoralis]|uniref:Uncharacterized protein n=1 Tax=Dallia pectoralis TaxID=75939 RepID=A0ACC2G4V8_DALPE|nr:hypothetical protein DPEC_G00206480 [Dallia pectoralis]